MTNKEKLELAMMLIRKYRVVYASSYEEADRRLNAAIKEYERLINAEDNLQWQ